MVLTKQEAIDNHRKMWNWIADETEKQQRKVSEEEYFKTFGIEDIPLENCYCCEYAKQERDKVLLYSATCQYCPLVWGENGSTCCSLYNEQGDLIDNGLYEKWLYSTDWKEAAELARKIANLPER